MPGPSYPTVAEWTITHRQELLAGEPSAVRGDPQLVDASASPTPVDSNGLKLRIGSPLRGAGLDLVDRGSRDYFGFALSSPVSMGAHELARGSAPAERPGPR